MSRLTFIKTYFNSGWCYEPLLVDEQTCIGLCKSHYWLIPRTTIGRYTDHYWLLLLPSIETVALESCPLFRVLKHRTPSSSICLSEEIHKTFALSQVFLLSSGGERAILVGGKAPSRSGFPYLCK